MVQTAGEKQPLMLRDKMGKSALAAALAAGALPALAFPAPSWWWLAWFGVSPCCWWCALRRPREGGVAGVVGNGRVRAGHPVLAAAECRPAAGGAGRWTRRVVGAVGWAAYLLLQPITLRGTLAAWRCCPARGCWPRRCDPGPASAVLGIARRVAVEPARHAGLGLTRRGGLTSFLLVATNTAIAGVILHRRVARPVITQR